MRPLVVTVIAFYQILRGVMYGLFGLSILVFGSLTARLARYAAEGAAMERFLISFGHLAGFIVLLAALFHLAAGYGLLQMQNWGRLLTILFSAVGLFLLLPFLRGAVPITFAVINAGILFYLVLPPIKRAFHDQTKPFRMAA